ncbi:Predicted lipase [Megamonas hypermegale]|uniref:Predicted lipase n=1 Tax=Megamonas hypermegale TaxID=158847 RepID=A0A239TYY3_9FIRM|nr:lipase family protein [Megamonas hypermegale]SNV02765.1 Predicted lipase [Megamonas hypermegale]
MQRIFKSCVLVVIMCIFFTNYVFGANKIENVQHEIKVEDVSMRYLAAWTALAVYNDKLSLLARNILQENGWQIDIINKEIEKSDIKLLLAEKQLDNEEIYFLSISGTVSWKDIQTDLAVESVAFSEFDDKSLVHKGFMQYVQDGFFTEKINEDKTLGEDLVEKLKADKSRKLYITGHSLGGAVAELLAARLSDMGIDKNQLKVITFGAPAVGNQYFVDKYATKLDLTRITMKGDPVKNLTQIANSKFVQFDTNIQWELPLIEKDKFAHNMLLYFDKAMRDYYDVTQLYSRENTSLLNEVDYVISIDIDFPEEIYNEEKYIRLVLMDKLKNNGKSYLFIEGNQEQAFVKAKNLNVKNVVIYKFGATKQRENTSNKRYYIDEMKYVYDKNGNLINGFNAGTDTNEMTVVQAALYTDYKIDDM